MLRFRHILRPHVWLAALIAFGAVGFDVHGQSLEQRLDEDAFLRGLIELELPDVLEHYIRTHPPEEPLRAARFEVAAAELRLRALDRSDDRHREALRRLLRARADLIELAADHPLYPVWLADQAEDLYFELLPVDGTELTVLFGLPDEQQRQLASETASRMNDLARRAEDAVRRVILAIESDPDFANDQALPQRRRRLAHDERDRRIAFLRGVAAVLHAELNINDRAARQELYETAAQVLEPLGDGVIGDLSARAQWYGGLALARLGRFDDAESEFRTVAENESSPRSDAFAARMGGVINRVERGGPVSGLTAIDSIEAKYTGADDLFYRVLTADHRFLLHLANAGTGDARTLAIRRAFRAYIDLLERPGDVEPEIMRAVVHDRLRRAAADRLPFEDLPVVATIARAERLARDGRDLGRAIDMLVAALRRDDVEPWERAEGLLVLGALLHEADRPIEAARAFLRFTDRFPDHARAQEAAGLAATVASAAAEVPQQADEANRLAGEALDFIFDRYPDSPRIDRWRYLAGRVALARHEHDQAIEHFASVSPGAVEFIDAQFMLITAQQRALPPDAQPAAFVHANDALLGEIDRVGRLIDDRLASARSDERRDDLRYYDAMLDVYRADAMIDLGRAEQALEAIGSIDEREGHDETILAQALRVRIEALQALGRSDEAQATVGRFLDAAPREAGAVVTSMIRHARTEVERLHAEGRSAAAREKATLELLPLARSLERWLAAADIPASRRTTMLRHAADAYRLGDAFIEALRLYDRLLVDAPDALEVLLGRAECLYGLGGSERLSEAMTIYRRLAAAGPAVDEHAYWLSQLRMLQILDRVQRNTDQIAPRIERLRLEDADLGGPRYRRAFEQLEATHR